MDGTAVVLAPGLYKTENAKTAHGLVRGSDRFDIVGVDPRGTGDSEGAIDCKVDQETQGVYSQPFTTPLNLDVGDLIRTDRSYIERCLRMLAS